MPSGTRNTTDKQTMTCFTEHDHLPDSRESCNVQNSEVTCGTRNTGNDADIHRGVLYMLHINELLDNGTIARTIPESGREFCGA